MSQPAALLICLALASAACANSTRWPHDLAPLDSLPWPAPAAQPAACTPFAPTLAAPALAPPSGPVTIDHHARLFATGVVTMLDLIVYNPEGQPDIRASGPLRLDLGGAGRVLAVDDAQAGRARARVIFDRPGRLTATTTFRDGRVGRTELLAYDTQLPVWDLRVDDGAFARLLDDPHGSARIPVRLTVGGTEYPARLRLHGGTSRDYPKKSFRIDLDGEAAIDGRRHLVLRGEWNDKSLLRNYLAYEVFRRGTWLPTPRTAMVHLRLNDAFYGVMLQVERIDRDFLAAHRLAPDGLLFEGDPPLGGRVADLAPLQAGDYAEVYPQHAGPEGVEPLRQLVESVLTASNADLAAAARTDLAVDDLLVYMAGMAVIQNHDHVRKNYYLYRDVAAGRGWTFLPWDLDLSFGHMWTEAEDVTGESMTSTADAFPGSLIAGTGQHNVLIERLLTYPDLRARMVAMTTHIVETVATPANIGAIADAALCRALPDVLADARKRATNAEYASRVDEVRRFVGERAVFLRTLH